MFYEIFCIFNQYRLITIFQNSRFFEKSIYFIVRPKFFSVKVPFRIGDIPRLQKNTVSLSCGGGASNPLLADGLKIAIKKSPKNPKTPQKTGFHSTRIRGKPDRGHTDN